MSTNVDAQGLIVLDERQCWELLARHFLGRVGLGDADGPLVFPVNYAVDGRSVVFRTAPGTKLAAARTRTPVVFEVDEATELFETGASVMVHGVLVEVTDDAERARLARLPIRTWAPGDRDHLVRVEPHAVSGRRIPLHQYDDGVGADGA